MELNNFMRAFQAILEFFIFSNPFQIKSSGIHNVIETNDGRVRGVLKSSIFENVEYYSYKGIPYAKSPIDATQHGKHCMQTTGLAAALVQDLESEDCLFLNVYVPADVLPGEKLAVLVYIHGGAFNAGTGNDDPNGPDFLIKQRVIVVTLNYRLGIFGFMSFGTPEYSGNMGLKDQQMALIWVFSNIEHFSGNNQQITLAGTSTGSVSTHFHMYSKHSRKYFRNAILMSGTLDNFWGYSEESDHLEFAYKKMEELGGENVHSVDELIEFYKSEPAYKLTPYGNSDKFFQRLSQPSFGPVLERKDAIRPFMTEFNTNTNIDMDAMFGFNSVEFITFYNKGFPEVYNYSDLNNNFSIPLPFRGVNVPLESPEYQQIAKEIRKFYFKDQVIDDNSLMQSLALLSDINFAYGIDKSAKRHARNTKSKTYYYRFSVDSKLNAFKRILTGNGHLPGAAHADEMCYLFFCRFFQLAYYEILLNPYDEQSKICLQTIEEFRKIVANFVKYGKPAHSALDSTFLPIQKSQVNFLDFTNDGLKPSVNPNQAANELWASIEQQVQQFN